MYMNDNPFGSLPQFGPQRFGQPQMPQMPRMAGPGGFNGGQMMSGGGMPAQQPNGQLPPTGMPGDPNARHGHHGMFGGPLGAMAPMFGLAGMMSGGGGLSKMLPFLLGGLGGGGLFSLLNKHNG